MVGGGEGHGDDGDTETADDGDDDTAPEDTSDGAGGDVKFDVPAGDEGSGGGDDPGEEGCTKVDFLFVIDNSGSMTDDQLNLIDNFPGFIDAIQNTLAIEDFHVMVTDTDAGGLPGWNPECQEWWDENDPWHITPCPFPPVPLGAPADMIPLLDDCDRTLGAGVDMPLGEESSNAECSFADGKRYMTQAEPDLTDAFACAARVGAGGNNGEKQAEALVQAVSTELNAVGGCNEGFLRNDALLVVTLLSDEYDVSSDPKDDPAAWAQAVIDAKAGKPENVVMLGLLMEFMGVDNNLQQMVDVFPHSAVEHVESTDYQPFFEAVIGDIEGACDGFVPPG